MYTLLIILMCAICIVLMFFILIQNPKGSGLGAGFGGGSSNLMGGVQRTTDFLDKATWGLIIGLFVLCIISTALISNNDTSQQGSETKTEKLIDE